MDKEWMRSIKSFRKEIMTIGYLDLLGMSEAIMNQPIDEVADKYISTFIAEKASHLFAGGEELIGEATHLKYVQFSDSSLFIGGANNEKDVRMTVYIISGMMGCLLNNCGIVARGAISIGEFCTIEEFNTYVGKPLVEAALIESVTDWVGLTFLMPKPERPELLAELEKYHWLSNLQVPIKAGKEDRLLEKGISQDRLIPVRWFIGEDRQHSKKLALKLKELISNARDKNAQKKLENGLSFIQNSLREGNG